MWKKIRQLSAVALAMVLVCPVFMSLEVYAAGSVEVDKKCSVKIDVTGSTYGEIIELPVTINLYKVADIDAGGSYQAVDSIRVDFSKISSKTTAKDWEKMAHDVKNEVDAGKMTVTATGKTSDGVAVIDDLSTGLYLVNAQQLLTDRNRYDFVSFLVSLPNNYYYSDTSKDEWVYENVEISLKPEKTDRYNDHTNSSTPGEDRINAEYTGNIVKTGDNSGVVWYTVLAFTSGLMLLYPAIRMMKKHGKGE